MTKVSFDYKTKSVKVENNTTKVVEITKTIEFEFGELAKQANFAVKVTSGGTSVLCCVVIGEENLQNIPSEPMVPLLVDYRERTYAAGKIPGGFFKREGKPREHEIHVSRLIDRTLRPLFSKDINRDIQVNVLVLSFDPEYDPTPLAVMGSALVVSLSEIPFEGSCSCFRLCKIDNEYIVNPSFSELEISNIDLIASFYKDHVLMIETEAEEVKEEELVKMLEYLKTYAVEFDKFQQQIVALYGRPKIVTNLQFNLDKLVELNRSNVEPKIRRVLSINSKTERKNQYKDIVNEIILSEEFCDSEILNDKTLSNQLKERVFFTILRSVVRKDIIDKQIRYDGRSLDDLREISCKVGVLPRTHGSAIFQRGETQALVTVTLGTASDMQIMDELVGEYKERFIFHYNFPGFATGEVRPDRGVSRRELGHGMLAKRAVEPVLPSKEEFPYTIRIVSDILESNGSSSMASVCGATLALLDAGVKISKMVAGVALGLVKEDDRYVILTDIAGLEDHCGDMDFKVAGTQNGITAIQLDLKILGLDIPIIETALLKAKEARLKILSIMSSVIDKPRPEISSFAPRIKMIHIPQDKIGDLIGPKGKNIKQIIGETQVKIDIEEDGTIIVSADNQQLLDIAIEKIEALTKDVEVGKIYLGKVKKVVNYGAFIEILPNKVGLLHISQFQKKVRSAEQVMSEGDEVYVKVIQIDEEGRPVLSQKGVPNKV